MLGCVEAGAGYNVDYRYVQRAPNPQRNRDHPLTGIAIELQESSRMSTGRRGSRARPFARRSHGDVPWDALSVRRLHRLHILSWMNPRFIDSP
jgi:hypothetical protein